MRIDHNKLQLAMANAKPPVSIDDLASKMGVPRNAVDNVLSRARSNRNAHLATVAAIAAALGVKAEEIAIAE